MRSFVTATMIAERLCSPRRDGQELLPQLVAKLITDSIPRDAIHKFRFPHGDQVYLPGPDGILVIDDVVQHLYVPNGISLWEMGTSTGPKRQADENFRKAEGKLASAFSDLLPSVTPDRAALVFVTSMRWESGAWVKEKRASSNWKSIKVVDAVDLEKWIEQCPRVMVWFAEECALPAEGLYDAEQYLRKLAVGFGVSAMSPELVLAGRNEDAERLRALVLESSTEAYIYGESAEEAAAFLAAASLKGVDAFAKKAPLIFADSRANLNLLATFGTEVTLVPVDSEALERAKTIDEKKWRLIVPEAESSVPPGDTGRTVTLGRCKRAAVEQYLVDHMKLPEHKVRQITRDTKGSLVALLWLVGSGPVGVPRWASRKDATTHASLILAGSWLGNNQNDTKVVERLSRKDYRDIETLLQSAEIPEGPWIHRGVEWRCASRDFVWGQLIDKVTETMLSDFQAIVPEVVGEKNPTLELPPANRYMAGVLGKTRRYSSSLRTGLVDSIARLAIFKPDGQGWADRIVGELLDAEGPEASDRWLSLVDVYSELAEAAPDVFLACLDNMIRLGEAKKLFQSEEADNVFFAPTSAHVYLLWALERLAWQKEYLSRVLRILARLAEIDPKVKTGNSPKHSIITILLPWSPQHSVTMQDAAQMVEMLYSTSPAVTWDVAIALLPTTHGVSVPTPAPTYREYPGKRKITGKEYWGFVCAVLEMMIQWAGNDGHRWASLVEAYPEVWRGYPEAGRLVTDALAAIDVDELAEGDKAVIHGGLRKLISHHREYADAWWAVPDSALVVLESLESRFLPKDAVLQYRHLFSWDPDVADAPMKRYENGWDQWISEKRAHAVKAVYDQDRLPGICRLVDAVSIPESMGQPLAQMELPEVEVVEFLRKGLSSAPGDRLRNPLTRTAAAYVWTKYNREGEKWLEETLALSGMTCTAEGYANLALGLPASPALWERLQQWGEEANSLYWKNVGIPDNYQEHWRHILDKWKEVQRPWSSLELVARLVDERHSGSADQKPSAEQVMDVLERALAADESVEPLRQQGDMLSYYVEHLFLFLDNQDTEARRMARLEWGWLRVLEHTQRSAKVLKSQVTSSPELFVDLLKAMFRGEGEPKEVDVSEERRRMAEQAFHVLRGIQTVPGYRLAGASETVNPSELREWVVGARKLAEQAGRLGVCDSQIGQILSFSPHSPDGSWPCVEVRDLFEEIQSSEMEGGLWTGKYNQRGVFFRGEGGRQEWDVAGKFRELAEKVRNGWPRTASILDALTKNYEAEAREWDERARKDEYE